MQKCENDTAFGDVCLSTVSAGSLAVRVAICLGSVPPGDCLISRRNQNNYQVLPWSNGLNMSTPQINSIIWDRCCDTAIFALHIWSCVFNDLRMSQTSI